jgi:hypothetical protein
MQLPSRTSLLSLSAVAVGAILLAGAAAATPSAAARAVSTAGATTVIGTGTRASCTSQAVVAAVAKGGVITFSCGAKPVTITMSSTAKVVNTSPRIVLNGGGKVTLSGGGKVRILYMNTCDPKQVWTTWHCYDQDSPQLTVENLTFIHGSAQGHDIEGGSGGAIYAQGGQLTVANSSFIDNSCYGSGPDLGGGAIRAYEEWSRRPVYIVHSTFSGGRCSNGGALSSIGVSWSVFNSVFSGNRATGWGANPPHHGTPGGGSGGAIYTDGNSFRLHVQSSKIIDNTAREGGGSIFFVSDSRTGTMLVYNSTLDGNTSGVFQNYPGAMYYLGHGPPVLTESRFGN